MISLCTALVLTTLPAAPAPAQAGLVAVRAGTIHLVEDGEVLEGGATVLLRDGVIVAVGADLDVPVGVQVVDYGADAVIVPGFVAASSPLALGPGAPRTAEPELSALASFDFYASYASDIASGVTSAYINPAKDRLIAGQGAVVKLAGEDPARRVLATTATLHGSISADARRVPGFWEPPIPATVDVGLGLEEAQYPDSTMGALWALDELIAAAREGRESEEFGPWAAAGLAPILEAGVPLRLRAETRAEIRALSAWAQERELNLIIEGGNEAGWAAAELAAAGQPVIVEMDWTPNSKLRDLGKGSSARWPEHDTAERLAEAGVDVAVSSSGSPRHLRFAAVSSLGGAWDAEAALRGITLTPAELLGVADRVGSLRAGKDADLVVLNGPPLDPTSSVLATWIDGEEAWSAPTSDAVVIAVAELYVGDGEVIAPAELLLQDGRIAELGRRVARPAGTRVVRGAVAMPGIVDALGHLGLEGSSKVPGTDYAMSRIVEPGDYTDRRVAKAGVTTVVLTPRKASSSGAPAMAYKPAASNADHQIVAELNALLLDWRDRSRLKAGEKVRELLEKGVAYDRKWKEYDAAMAQWTPPPPEPEKDADEDEKEEDKDKDKDKDKDGDKGDEAKDKKKDKKKKKKDKDKEEDPFPVTGIWTAAVIRPPATTESSLRMQLSNTNGIVEGFLRCDAVSVTLVPVAGTWGEELAVSGLGSQGLFRVTGTIEEGELTGSLHIGGADIELIAKRVSRDYPFARRPGREKPEKADKPKAPKGMPKEPKLDARMEPLRAALRGELALIVQVDREDEILACVDAFESAGLKPVLYGAEDAHLVIDQLRGRVAGVLLSEEVTKMEAKTGTLVRNRYAELQSAGIPVAFHSAAEEGAAQLPLVAAFAVSEGMSPSGALRALTADAAEMLAIGDRVGRLAVGMDADVLVLDGSPLETGTSVLRVFVGGKEVH